MREKLDDIKKVVTRKVETEGFRVDPEYFLHELRWDELAIQIPESEESGGYSDVLNRLAESIGKEIQRMGALVSERSDSLWNQVRWCRRELLFALQNDLKPAIRTALLADVDSAAAEIGASMVQIDSFAQKQRLTLSRLLEELQMRWSQSAYSSLEAPWPMLQLELRKSRLAAFSVETLLVELSNVYVGLKQVQSAGASDASTWVPPSSFERSTVKYWVRTKDVLALKVAIVQHLPVLVFGLKQGMDPKDPELDLCRVQKSLTRDSSPITSVYLDNLPTLDLYHRRVDAIEGNKLIRVRWYGDSSIPSSVFVEQKTHHEGWVLGKSVKERFEMSSAKLLAFCRDADYLPSKRMQHLVDRKKLKPHLRDEQLALAREIKQEIIDGSLAPMVRTLYRRAAFQLASSNDIRISLDTDMRLLKESGDLGAGRPFARDFSLNPPALDEEVLFPYAILEVKLQKGQPDWIRDLVDGPLVVRADKFSKFQHGVAVLWTEYVRRVPWWLGQPTLEGRDWIPAGYEFDPIHGQALRQLPVGLSAGPDLDPSARHSDSYNRGDLSVRELLVQLAPTAPVRAWLRRWMDQHLRREAVHWLDGVHTANPLRAKQVKIPIKVVPNSFLGNERTFLQWVTSALLFGMGGVTILAIEEDYPEGSALLLRLAALVAIAFMVVIVCVALFRFHVRTIAMRSRTAEPAWVHRVDTLQTFLFALGMLCIVSASVLFRGELLAN